MLRLGLIADIHMQDGDASAIEASLDPAIDRIAAFDPHRTVVLGDLIEDEGPDHDRRNLERVLETLAPLDPRYLAGNHDGRNLTEADLVERFGSPLSGTESIEAVELVYLDTACPGGPRWRVEVGSEGRARLEEGLTAGREVFVFAHHPVHYHDIADNPWFGNHPELAFAADKGWIRRLLVDHGTALATFNGHLHEHDHTVTADTHHFTINAVSKERPDSTQPTGTHALVTLDDRLSVEVFDTEGFVRGWEVPR